MKLIMEGWRQYLNEGIDSRIQAQVDKFISDPKLHITIRSFWGSYVEFMYTDAQGKFLRTPEIGTRLGRVRMKYNANNQYDQCYGKDAWVVKNADAAGGMGPLLYELAIEYASKNGQGLMADRFSVSDEAHAVWKKYARRGDVDKKQLDISKAHSEVPNKYPQLTPDNPVDDCYQGSAVEHGGEEWHKDPLSSIYSKKGSPVTDMLPTSKIIIKNDN